MNRRWHLAAVLALAIAASSTSLPNQFVFDDVPIIEQNPRVHHLAPPWRYFGQTYWPPELGAALYRPLTMLAFALQWAVGDGRPVVFHATSVLLYLAVCAAVLALARLVLPQAAALVAAALFAVHPVHVESVAYTVGQAELMVGLWLVVATAYYVSWRRKGALTGRHVAALGGLYALACFTKEHGVVLPGLLVAAELTILREPNGRGSPVSPRRHLPISVALLLVAAGFLAARTAVLGSFTGDIAHTALRGATPAGRLLTMLAVVPHWLRLLLVPAELQADYMPQELGPAAGVGPAQLTGIIILAAAVVAALLTRRKAPAASFGLLWAGVALVPVSNLVLPTGILLSERSLFTPSVGAVLALGALGPWLALKYQAAKPAERALAVLGLVVIVGAATAHSARRQRVWRSNDILFRQTVLDAPLSYQAHWAYAAQLYRAGNHAEAEAEYRLAVRLWPHDPNLLADLGDRYAAAGACERATALYRQALELAPTQWTSRTKLVLCLLDSGNLEGARVEAERKRTGGDPDATRIQAVVDSVAAARRPEVPAGSAAGRPQ